MEATRESMLLYAVTDRSWLRGRTLAFCVEEALKGGATFVQLREKNASFEERCELARQIIPICRLHGVPFVVNDDVETALAVGADGVHVGQDDMACAEARRRLGPDAIVGVSAQTVEQAIAAERAGASYLGVGAVMPTATKPDAVDVSLDDLDAICRAVSIPVVAIGGLNPGTVGNLAGALVDGVAVVSALFAADDIQSQARELVRLAKRALGNRQTTPDLGRPSGLEREA